MNRDANEDANKRYRYGVDLILSYWIFMWYVLYAIIGSPIINPKLALIIGLITNICNFMFMVYVKTSPVRLALFVLQVVTMKVIPLFILRNSIIHWRRDSHILVWVCIAYLLWLRINKTDAYDVYVTRKLTPMTDFILDSFH